MIPTLYRTVTAAGAPVLRLWLQYRAQQNKEDPARLAERRGIAGHPRPPGTVVWVHAASVGESLSALPLLEAVLSAYSSWSAVVTTGTRTSASLLPPYLEDIAPGRTVHQFVPLDHPRWVRRFLDHWRPDLVLWTESELWPNLLGECHKRSIPSALVNGRMSERSFRRWKAFPSLIQSMLSGFSLCMGQSTDDTRRLQELGAINAVCPGNLKYASPPLPVDGNKLDAARRAIGGRPVWLASSTHPGEELVAAQVHRALAAQLPGLLTIIAPRHPDRGEDIARALTDVGMTVACRSHGTMPNSTHSVWLADTLGELGLFYRLSPVSFIGKSLIGTGGQNPLEPARLGSAVLFGPHMGNFAEISTRMLDHGAAIQVPDPEGLACTVSTLLTDTSAQQALTKAAQDFCQQESAVLERIMEYLSPLCTGKSP